MNQKPIYILGISESHTASAALLRDGQIIACASEERFTRQKLQAGIPQNAIKFCLDFAKIKPQNLTLVACADIEPPFLPPFESPYTHYRPPFPFFLNLLLGFEENLEKKFPISQKFFYELYKRFVKFQLFERQRKRLTKIQKTLPLAGGQFSFFTHHTCHSSSAIFSSNFPQNNQPALVFTADGVGDFESGTIYKFDRGGLQKLVSIDFQQSLGFFYQHITQFLGLKPVEDEYKVMGLAPYADFQKTQEVYKLLSPYFKVEKSKNKWHLVISEYHIWRKLPDLLRYKRFDHIARATQQITEEILVKWIKNAIQDYQIRNIVCSGGVFANVKINQKIAALGSVKEAFFMPSPGDETNALGAAYMAYYQLTQKLPKPLQALYLGPSFDDHQIKKALGHNSPFYKLKKLQNINQKVAQLLKSGEAVARFAGRMEFGARALGNRSILASPSDKNVVEFINHAIKNRDFWMPFAPTILRERAKDYIILHKADSQFMNVAYNTTPKGQIDLAAAIHPYDKTTRPQILDREINPQYYDLIKKFEKLTNIGAVLNTSFNLHGEPIVASPQDALSVFRQSKLKYLQLEDYLIEKT